MKPLSLLLLPIFCLATACSDKDKPGTADSDAQEKKKGNGLSGISVNSGGGEINNTYVRQNWGEADVSENEWTEEFAAATTPEEQLNVIGRKESTGPEQLPSLIRLALRKSDERVRIAAVQTMVSLIELPPAEVADLVNGAVHDPSSEVRSYAMEAILELRAESRLEVYRSTIAAPDGKVRKDTIVELGRMATKPAFEVLIHGLKDGDPTFRQDVDLEIKQLVNQKFETYEEAQTWWDGGGSEGFSDDMQTIVE